MNINATLIGQAIWFGLFIWITMKFVWPPLQKAMADRQKLIADGLAAATGCVVPVRTGDGGGICPGEGLHTLTVVSELR